MAIEVVDTLFEIFGDRVGRLEVSIVQSGLLQHEKPGLNEIEPGRIRGRPEELDSCGSRSPQVPRSLVRAEVVPYEIDLAIDPETGQHRILEKRQHYLAGLGRTGDAHCLASMRSEGG